MRIGRFTFTPSLVPTVATLLALPVLISLGFWQLERAEQRQAIATAYETRDQRLTIDLNRDGVSDSDSQPLNAGARGTYDDDRQLLVDNQPHRRQTGYHVLTPLHLEGRDEAVLVDRGWVPAGDRRSELPDVAVGDSRREIQGHVDQGPPTGLRLGGIADGETGWPLRIQYVAYDELEERLGYPLLPVVLRLDPAAPDGFTREWGPAFEEGYGPERNQGYAVQWFGLAAALVVIFIAVNLRRVTADDAEG
ncbi:SURF1 family protein [Aquisalimonas sp.]|uniref:SURF1 family protein n=1 Tax=Aquisalimonas sp. TaxID=1872621 RepID=UPI0025BC8625|nr:SURF1 family protein [Aquisalimonas sp.]